MTVARAVEYYSGNYYLGLSQMQVNATYINNYMGGQGWSKNAICAMLGNMQRESTINPGIWQNLDAGNTSLGYGLVQWTPSTNYTDWCDTMNYPYDTMDSNLKRILYELENGLQWIATDDFPMSFREFTTSTLEVDYLTEVFLANYERAGVSALQERIENANYWFEYLEDTNPYFPRLTDEGLDTLIYWGNANPFTAAGFGLPNCTCYAWGRFWEISDYAGIGANVPTLPTNDAGLWWEKVEGYSTGQTPKLGAVICWSDNSGGAGHVAIVEQINSDGSLLTSNSAYNSTYFYTKTIPNTYALSGYTFQGFIYNPHAGQANVDDNEEDGELPILHNQKTQYEYEEKTPLMTYYQVKKGDTLSAISKKYKVNIHTIKRVRFERIVNKNEIIVGEVLLLPKTNTEVSNSTNAKTYTVQKGDTLSAIARRFGVSVASIQKKNNIQNANFIVVGQVLHI